MSSMFRPLGTAMSLVNAEPPNARRSISMVPGDGESDRVAVELERDLAARFSPALGVGQFLLRVVDRIADGDCVVEADFRPADDSDVVAGEFEAAGGVVAPVLEGIVRVASG